MAIAYAQYISCTNKQPDDACGECPSCIKYNNLVHPDLHFIFPVATSPTVKKDPVSKHYLEQWRELNAVSPYFSLAQWQDKIETGNKLLLISKNESAEILKVLSLKTFESTYKVVIIWYPEKFNISSANKLLKAIEEPPPKTLFLLVAHDPEQIISTILSRTQLVKIGRIKEEALQKSIQQQFELTAAKAQEIAHLSDGSFIAAKKLIEHSETEELYLNLFKKWMRSAFVANVIGLIEWSEEIASATFGREKQVQFLNYSLRVFRESLMQNYGDSSLERSSENTAQFLQKFAPFIHGKNCIDIITTDKIATYKSPRRTRLNFL